MGKGMSEKYEPIRFDSWQELAKYVIDGGEVYVYFNDEYKLVKFDGMQFNWNLIINNFYTKKQLTLEELIAIKPRLCWVLSCDKKTKIVVEIAKTKDGYYFTKSGGFWHDVQMLTDDEIKQFLSDGE